jgi:acyl-coenzyme A thioesterase PaaI-like protein
MLQLSLAELQGLLKDRLDDVLRQSEQSPDVYLPTWERTQLETLTEARLVARRQPARTSLRRGGTWSGPAQFEMIDMMGFLLCVAGLPSGSDAHTINVTVNFLEAPPFSDLIAEARMMRRSRRSAVVGISLRSEERDGEMAYATASYLLVPAATGADDVASPDLAATAT